MQNGIWVENKKSEYIYDTNGNQILKIVYDRDNNAWVEHQQTEYAYDFAYSDTDLIYPSLYLMNNMRTEEKYYDWNGTDWIDNHIVST